MQRNRSCFATALLVFLLSLMTAHPLAQSQSAVQSSDKDNNPVCEFRITTFMIIVRVWVTDETDKDVSTLEKRDFIIYEDDVEQEIDYLSKHESGDTVDKRAMYKIGYTPTNNSFDGKLRKIRVDVRAKEDRKLKAQISFRGYFATKEFFQPEPKTPDR